MNLLQPLGGRKRLSQLVSAIFLGGYTAEILKDSFHEYIMNVFYVYTLHGAFCLLEELKQSPDIINEDLSSNNRSSFIFQRVIHPGAF